MDGGSPREKDDPTHATSRYSSKPPLEVSETPALTLLLAPGWAMAPPISPVSGLRELE